MLFCRVSLFGGGLTVCQRVGLCDRLVCVCVTNRTRSVRAVAQPEGGSRRQLGLVPPPRFTIVVMVGGRGYFSRHRFELCLCAQLSLSSLLDPLTR